MSSRRDFLRNTTLLGLGSALTPVVSSATEIDKPLNPDKKRALRVAHITDVHILDKPNAEKSFAKILQEINSMEDKPELIINTGDSIMDANGKTREEVEKRWNVWQSILKSNNKIPVKSVIGNHDEWWGPKHLNEQYKSDKRYGKAWAIEMLNMPARYYSFEQNGWHFIALDSINKGDGYHLDEEQTEWLRKELETIPASRPICVFNHVPLISVCSFLYYTQREESKNVKFPTWDMHIDNRKIKDIFFKHKNVKIALSGHIHYIDAVEYLGVKYLCNGAASGNWWGNPIVLDEFPPVYGILDLYTDGSSDCRLVYYDYQ
jgi:predicted phosphodiesterase